MADYDDDDDDKRPDYFENDDVEEPAKPKKPKYTPEDPRYWTEGSGRWDHLRPARPPKRAWIWIGCLIAGLVLLIVLWSVYLSPCVTGATESGYVERIERHGNIFATYEGVILPYRDLMDTAKVYQRDFVFTAENPGVAAKIKRLMVAGKPVRVEYVKYRAALPWRGESAVIVTGVDSVDPVRLLPPDRSPALRRN